MSGARVAAALLTAAALSGPAAAATPAAPLATGDLTRSYVFAATGETMTYRLYVPKAYDAKRPTPLVIVLHGGGSDENRPFDNTGLQAAAEARGYLVLSVRGYSPFGGYGNFYPVVVTRETAARGKDFSKRAAANAPANPKLPVEAAAEPPAARDDYYEQPASQLIDPRIGELSEREVFAALAEVRRTYAVDPHRLYLMGNSAGGVGTLYLAAKYPRLFAAVSPSAGAIASWSYPWWRLREAGLPILFVHGDQDGHANAHWSAVMATDAKAGGVDASFLSVPGGSHPRAWTMVLPQTFDFFAAHRRADPAPLPQ